ncbi:MAG: hypothetical protein JNL58_24985 [Planctomyces sp.]|nr:hypothetical protein [Planctomyces sp.]
MNETITSAHSSRSRRTVAILTWIGLVAAAALLWRGRLTGTMRTDSNEVVALFLAAYTTFASIFAWMLFSPGRRFSEEGPALFLSGGLTLIPGCIIAFCLMPPDSPLRGWLTFGVFVITVIAVMSPIPEEFFAVPRERSSYFRPISESLFDGVEMRQLISGFDHLKDQVTGSSAVLEQSAPPTTDIPGTIAKDPWQDPFRGTDIRPAEFETRPASQKRSVSPHRPASPERSTPPPVPVIPPAPAAQTTRTSPVASPAPLPSPAPRVSAAAPHVSVPATTVAPPRVSPATAADPKPVVPAARPAIPPAVGFRTPVAESSSPQPITHSTTNSPAARVVESQPTVQPVVPRPAPVSPLPPVVPFTSPNTISAIDSVKEEPGLQEFDQAFEQWGTVSEHHHGDEPVGDESDDDHASDFDNEPLRFERIKDSLGGEMIEGTIRVVFEPGQKRANLHVPFSPPLRGIPEVECEPVGGDDLRLKVPVRQPYGIRIEARRSDAAERLETEIGFAAVCAASRR